MRDYRGNIKPKYVPFKKYLATFISSHRNCADNFETPCIYTERSRNIYVIFPLCSVVQPTHNCTHLRN
jgi:hypothetical protein